MTFIAFLMLAAVARVEPEATPELLPKTPPGWRFERIDFPLSFAPDLKFTGFEELRFAPGMFDAKSDTYFTYIFAMQINNDVTLNAKTLKDLFETYYRGLCKKVAKGKEFDIDESKIVAAVREDHYESPHSRRFMVTLESYDPFVTGKPLTLNLAVLVTDKGKKEHRLFASVSPKPLDDPVWKVLLRMERDFHKNQTRSDR